MNELREDTAMKTARVGATILLIAFASGACAATVPRGEEGGTDSLPAAAAREKQIERNPPTWCEGLPVEVEETRAEDGTLQRRQSIVRDEEGNSVAHGTVVHFWDSGEKKLEIHYHCGVKHGTRSAWHSDGTKWSVGSYVNGLDHGTWTEWSAQGTKVQEFTMNYGVWNGLHMQWYPNGTKKREVRYVNGLIQGPLTFWNDSGAVLACIDFVDGKEQPTPRQGW